jgi:hypothetical protein
LTTAFRHLIWTVSSVSAFAADPEMIDRFVHASRLQRTVQRNKPTQVEITATILQSRRQSQLRAVRHVSDQGEVGYEVLQTSGDDAVRRQVIARYLTAESQSRETDATALTPVNYKFRLKANVDCLGRRIAVFQLTPRRKKNGLFKGELWVDEITGMPVRESGQLVRSPNWLIKRILFVRTYEIRNGLALPTRIDSTVETRVAGTAEISIQFSDVNP